MTFVLDYKINNIDLPSIDQISDLEVVFDTELGFVKHIDYIVVKVARMLGFIKRNYIHMSATRAIKNTVC